MEGSGRSKVGLWRAAIGCCVIASACDTGERNAAPVPTAALSSATHSVSPLDACLRSENVRENTFAATLIERVNEVRATGTDCGRSGAFGPVAPLTVSPKLNCAARLHAGDMAVRGFFSHENPDGLGSDGRARLVGFTGAVGENLAWGQATADDVVASWLQSPSHCKNMFASRWSLTGAGYNVTAAGRTLWSQLFGAP